jgi:hypothetical protein
MRIVLTEQISNLKVPQKPADERQEAGTKSPAGGDKAYSSQDDKGCEEAGSNSDQNGADWMGSEWRMP